jgi:competence protein ComEC
MQADFPSSDLGSGGSISAAPGPMPLFHAAWLFAAGIVAAHWFWMPPSWVLIALGLAAGLACLAAFRAQRIVWLPFGVLWCLLGAWCAWMEPQPAPAPELTQLSDDLLRTVEGTVVDAGPVRVETAQDVNPGIPDRPVLAVPAQQLTQRIDPRVSRFPFLAACA